MLLTDVHNHTSFSPDGRNSMEDMLATAYKKGLAWYGIADHFNYDYDRMHLTEDGKPVPPIDAAAYFKRGREMQKEYEGRMHVLIGAEFGYDHPTRVQQRYIETEQRYKPDFVVNSVHTCLGGDCFFPHYCNGKTRAYAYNVYLYRVLESLDASYPYDIVAHIGYCARNATYDDFVLRYEDFADVLDEILKRIIAKGKILEVNSSAKKLGDYLPGKDILTRYYELGGREVSFASDAHFAERVADRRAIVVQMLREVGFSCITVPFRGRRIRVDI